MDVADALRIYYSSLPCDLWLLYPAGFVPLSPVYLHTSITSSNYVGGIPCVPLSRVYLASTLDVTHVIKCTRFSPTLAGRAWEPGYVRYTLILGCCSVHSIQIASKGDKAKSWITKVWTDSTGCNFKNANCQARQTWLLEECAAMSLHTIYLFGAKCKNTLSLVDGHWCQRFAQVQVKHPVQ